MKKPQNQRVLKPEMRQTVLAGAYSTSRAHSRVHGPSRALRRDFWCVPLAFLRHETPAAEVSLPQDDVFLPTRQDGSNSHSYLARHKDLTTTRRFVVE
jgi:hypothetical protein